MIYELGKLGVSASEEGGNPITDSPAVEVILSLLTLSDHPGDGIAAFHIENCPLLDALREELLARNYLSGYDFAFDAVMPEQRWEDWLQVNDKVVVEAAAIPAESFVVDVAEPTDAEDSNSPNGSPSRAVSGPSAYTPRRSQTAWVSQLWRSPALAAATRLPV